MRRGNDQKLYPLPTIPELQALSGEIDALTRELNTARLEGFLAKALAAPSTASRTKVRAPDGA
jgi:hypothetical protein